MNYTIEKNPCMFIIPIRLEVFQLLSYNANKYLMYEYLHSEIPIL